MRKAKVGWLILFTISGIVIVAAPFIGSTAINVSEIFHDDSTANYIFFNLRLPRVLFAFLAGAALAVAGAVFQALFRNPLASPFTLGVLAGGSFGATVAIILFGGSQVLFLSMLGINIVSVFTFAGCLLDVALVYLIAKMSRGFSISRLLLAGVVLNFFFASLVQLIVYTSDPSRNFELSRFMLGYLGVSGYDAFFEVLPLIILGIFSAFYLTQELNLMQIGEEFATTKGVNTNRVKNISFLTMSLMTAGVIAISGPILFVGLMTPHIVRKFTGSHQFRITLGSIFVGGVMLVVCDTIARSVMPVGELPVGVITSMIGGPFFLILLITDKRF
ncbi:MAG: iron ABC transporter permease [Planctomycetes bacterium]|nr:iron ABC transporter permease [Planctomycetota bacterium]